MPAAAGPAHRSEAPRLRLDGFEGPLDLLLELARAQKVDLSRISILQLVEQYLAVVEATRQLRLELAADWLVMAAWLAWLKSRLLLPREAGQDTQDADAAAGLLAERLAELAHVGRAAAWLGARDRLGHQVFARGAPEDLVEIDRSGLLLALPQLLDGIMTVMRRQARKRVYRPRPVAFWTVQDALARLRLLLGDGPPAWCTLEGILPEPAGHDPAALLAARAARAAILLAGLELARDGVLELRQDHAFDAILLRRSRAGALRKAAE
jgi:segregation and condensation protein A